MRRRGYLAAARTGDPRSSALLLRGLRDPEERVRAAAAFGLALLRDTTAVDSLARVAQRGGGEDAGQAVFALGRMNTAAAHAAVAVVIGMARGYSTERTRLPGGVIQESHRDYPTFATPTPDLLGAALLAIWRFRRLPEDAGLAAEFAFRPDTAVRWRATYALMRLGDPASVPALLRLLTDAMPEVRALAARGLRAPVVDSAGRRAAVQAALVAALADPAPHVRINAANALAGYRAPEAVTAMGRLLADADVNVALAAAGALGALGQRGAAPALRAVVADSSRPLSIRAAALASLIRVDPGAGVPIAATWASLDASARAPTPTAPAGPLPGPWRHRFYAALALGGAPWAQAGGQLQALARDADPRVAAQALESMTRMFGDTLAPPRALLVEKLAAPDPIVRAMAIGVLAARVEPGNLALYLDSYGRAVTDTMDDAARAALDAIAALARRDSAATRAFFARFPRSADPVARRDAFEKLGKAWGPVAPVETGRDTTFYLDIVRRYVAPQLAGAAAPRVRVRTTLGGTPDEGAFVLELDGAAAPLTVANFLSLADGRYFDGHRWHRVVPNFVVQDGDPRGDGNGGPGWVIRDELNPLPYLRGTLGMALSGPDTGGSQFFVALSPQPHLDAGYTVFGRVAAGFDVVDRVLQDDIIRSVEVVR